MTEKPKKFPGVPGRPDVVTWRDDLYQVIQTSLTWGLHGPEARTEAAAIRAWNRAVEKAREGK